MKRVIVIGGGIAGLSIAYFLKKRGVHITLFERDSSVGGAIKTVLKHDRYLLELGPNTFLGSSEIISEVSREIQVDHHLVINNTKKRYIFAGERLHEVPVGPRQFLRSQLVSGRGKFRTLMEPFIRSKTQEAESLASFVERRAGREILTSLVDPFVSGVWAGDPFQLEMKSVFPRLVEIEEQYGSILKGMRHLKGKLASHGLISFKWGMQTLPSRLHDIMHRDIRTDITAEAIEQLANGRWVVYTGTHGESVDADAVVIATPVTEAARLLMPLSKDIFAPMMGIPYVSLAVVHTVFRRSEIPMDLEGFGFLIPRREKIRILGTIWSSVLFPNRSPNGETLLTSFIGGATDPDATDLGDHELLTHTLHGLESTMKIRAQPRFHNITRISQAIPQYAIGHGARLNEIQRCLAGLPGMFLAGNYFKGISVADTISYSKKTSNLVKAYLNSSA